MSWQLYKKNQKSSISIVTITPGSKKIYFSRYLMANYFDDKDYVLVRYNSETKFLAFQPFDDNENALKLNRPIYNKSGHSFTASVVAGAIMKQFKLHFKETQRFRPTWDNTAKWLVIDIKKPMSKEN